jgi:putative endonuclease
MYSQNNYYVYILCSTRNGTLYVGVTNNLVRRIYEHKTKCVLGFSEKYKVDKLVYMETYNSIEEAIHREKCLKKWNRKWKIRLIEEFNPEWHDLYETIV